MSQSTGLMSKVMSMFSSAAVVSAEEKLMTGVTWNGDINYSSLGVDVESALLELDQKMVLPEECRKTGVLDEGTRLLLDNLFEQLINRNNSLPDSERAKNFGLLFRYLFYLRSVRVAGKKSRALFYYLFKRVYDIFPKTCCALIELVPDFGYFADLDKLSTMYSYDENIVDACINTYIKYLNVDCQLIFGKSINLITSNEAKSMNENLKKKSLYDLRQFVGSNKLSLAAKWFKREGKKNDDNRLKIIFRIFFPNTTITFIPNKQYNYHQMVLRHIISALSQCLNVIEQNMCETNPEYRTWADIDIASVPAKAMTKYRKALGNEKLKENLTEVNIETGNRNPDSEDRIKCRQNLLKALIDGKLKGAAQDIDRLSKIIFSHISFDGLSKSLSSLERSVISTQWKDLVDKVRTEINIAIEESKLNALETGQVFIDPRNIIPVVDTSGSMVSVQVQDTAIGLGVLATSLSSLPGCMISFSDKPAIFYLEMNDKKDVFDHFLSIARGPMGYSTNIDATYKLLLDLMVKNKVESTDYSLLFLTDGQFDSQAHDVKSSDFETTFIKRIEKDFTDKGYNLPRMIFWNLNSKSPGFCATSITRGVQLVSGYSQTLMIQVFTGDYKYELQEDGTIKISTSPWETFLKALLHQGYDIVLQTVAQTGEGCLKHLRVTE